MVQKLRNPIAQLLQNLQQLKWNIEWLFGIPNTHFSIRVTLGNSEKSEIPIFISRL